ncbi:hypothetical protein [Phytohabitans rumicis]|uniref:hypothetical protein n=1 Tax=Phytohabitans rumicis TaxID=1076125 RepID=UPI0015639840|nr:hypothetical protein [Phytohabitans rumicis]
MSIHGGFLIAVGVFGTAHVAGELFRSPLLPSAGVLAWAALCGYAVLAGRGAPRTVWLTLAAGLLILGLLGAADLLAASGGTTDAGYFVYGPPPPSPAPLEILRDSAPLLLAYLLLAIAVLAQPGGRRTRWGVIVAAVGAAVAAGYAVLEVWSRGGGASRVAVALPATALAVLAVVAAGRSPRPVAAAGAVLIGLAALSEVGTALDQIRFSPDGVFYTTGLMVAGAGPAAHPAVPAALQLAGAAAVAIGCLRTGTPAEPLGRLGQVTR